MDQYLVTVDEFRRFVKATGYVTYAERPLNPADYPDADPSLMAPGSLVFQKSQGPVDLNDYHNWWAYVPWASWKHPEGPGSDLSGRNTHSLPMYDFFTPRHPDDVAYPCCAPNNPRVSMSEEGTYTAGQPGANPFSSTSFLPMISIKCCRPPARTPCARSSTI